MLRVQATARWILRSLQLVARARGANGPSAPLSSAGIRAIQRTAGNRAACQVIKVQRLQHPDFPKKAAEMNDMELLKAYRFNVKGDSFGIGLPPADLAAVRTEMRRRRIPETSTNPLDDHRDLLPTRGDVATEVAKPTVAAAALAAGNLGARGLSTAPGAISPGGEKDSRLYETRRPYVHPQRRGGGGFRGAPLSRLPCRRWKRI